MLGDVNKSLKSFLCYGLRSEENLASLNSHFDQIANILINNEQNDGTSGESREQILARILSLEIEIDKIHQINNQVINQSNINEVIDQMTDRNKKVRTMSIIFKLETIQKSWKRQWMKKVKKLRIFAHVKFALKIMTMNSVTAQSYPYVAMSYARTVRRRYWTMHQRTRQCARLVAARFHRIISSKSLKLPFHKTTSFFNSTLCSKYLIFLNLSLTHE